MSVKKKLSIIIVLPVFALACVCPVTGPTNPNDTPDSATHTPTPTVTPTTVFSCPPASPPIPDWPVYCNDTYEFYAQYPPDAVVGTTDFNFIHFDLPFVPDTNLSEKYVEITVQQTTDTCESQLAEGIPPEMLEIENEVINGINFSKTSGSDAGVGNYWEWITYITGRDNICVKLKLVLHSTNPLNYPTPPPEFDFNLEVASFEQMVESFSWYTP